MNKFMYVGVGVYVLDPLCTSLSLIHYNMYILVIIGIRFCGVIGDLGQKNLLIELALLTCNILLLTTLKLIKYFLYNLIVSG